MHYGNIKYCDIANGEGVRTTLFVSGCSHHCAGCFQPETWDFSFGEPFTDAVADAVIESLQPSWIDGLTFLGGEPMEPENQACVLALVRRVRSSCPGKTVWCYTGDVYEDLANPASPRHTACTDELLASLDVLVDGPYVEALHDVSLRFRGSRNQRVIDMPATRAAGSVVLWSDGTMYASHDLAPTAAG